MFAAAAPLPRFRIYTSPRSYSAFIKGALTKGSDRVRNDTAANSAVSQFESALCDYLKMKHAVCVPQNRVGVYLTIKAMIKPGQQVIVSPYTIADVTNMVILAGGRPLFADVERQTCNISADEVARLINKDIGLVMITHLHGLMADADRIKNICAEHGVPMIEDAAQAFGSKENGVLAGTIGDAGIFSFGMYKNYQFVARWRCSHQQLGLASKLRTELETFTNSAFPYLLKKVRSGLMTDIVTHPLFFKSFTFWMFRYGFLNDVEWINKKVRIELNTTRKTALPEWYKSRYTDAQARLAMSQLATVESFSKERVQRGLMYYEGLKDIPELIIPPARTDGSHTYTYFPIQYKDRNDLIKFMMRHYCDVAAQHYKNNADLDSFRSSIGIVRMRALWLKS